MRHDNAGVFTRKRYHPLAWLGYPFVRVLQGRFAWDSKRAMVGAVGPENSGH